MVIIWILVFLVSLLVLIKSSDYFTKSAEKIGLHFGMPAFIVGVTIVAVGTSLPELVSSIFAVLRGSSEIVTGNVVGSNIANIFLILGVAAIISKKKLEITYKLLNVDLILFVASAFLLAITIWDGKVNLYEGIILLIGIIIYTLYAIKSHKIDPEIKRELKGEIKNKKLHINTWIMLIVSSIFIYISAKYTIDSVIELSSIFNIGKEIIAMTAVALGTSLPELMVTISAAKRAKPEIAVGNVLGSNIFNSFVVMGIPALISPLIVTSSILTLALPIMLIATLLFFFIAHDRQVIKWEGWILILFYLFFMGKSFNLI
jgi:cation:H+ antiporter